MRAGNTGNLHCQPAQKVNKVLSAAEVPCRLNDVFQTFCGLFKRGDRLVRPKRGVNQGKKSVRGQLGFIPVVVYLKVLHDLALGRHARVPGAQDDPGVCHAKFFAHVAHQTQTSLIVFHHHINQGNRNVPVRFKHGAGLFSRKGADDAHLPAAKNQPLDHQAGHLMQSHLVIDDHERPWLQDMFIAHAAHSEGPFNGKTSRKTAPPQS